MEEGTVVKQMNITTNNINIIETNDIFSDKCENVEEQMKIEIITSTQSTKKRSHSTSESTTENTIEVLKENINSIETTLGEMKNHINNIVSSIIQKEKDNSNKEQSPLKQQKIKDTALFKGSCKIFQPKKIKMDIGFNIQRSVTPELSNFMKLDAENNKTTLNEATKYIMNYINTNRLQDTTNQTTRKYINVDESLNKLFNLSELEKKKLTYFNVHKYIHSHFIAQS